MLIVSSYKYSLTPCPVSLFDSSGAALVNRLLWKTCKRRELHKRSSDQYSCPRLQKAKRLMQHSMPSLNIFKLLRWVRSNKPRCSHCRYLRRTRSLACARTWRRRGTSSASAGFSGLCLPPSQARPGKCWTDTNLWCERERWSPSTVEILTRFTRSSKPIGLRASRTRSFKNCGWTRITERRRDSAGGRWDRWRNIGSARSSPCLAPSGTASRRRIALR